MAQRLKRLLQCGRPGFDPWVRKIPWRRKWQPTPVFLPGESHGRRSLVGYNPRVAKSRTQLSNFTFTVCMCKSQSPSSSPFSPPWCPYTCSLCICLYFCFANRFICTVFFFNIPWICINTQYIVFLRLRFV